MTDNALFYGDNLKVLREHLSAESVDLIYLDPPFNSKATYNVLYKSPAGKDSTAQVEAFEDTWKWSEQAEEGFHQVLESGHLTASEMLRSLRTFLHESDIMAYLCMMAIRLIEMHRVLKPTGSIYLHCDPTASHYLKLLMDAIFGTSNFRNEIIWQKIRTEKAQTKVFSRLHDTIFFYSKGLEYKFLKPHQGPSQEYIDRYYNQVELETGRRYQLISFLQGGPGPERRFGDRTITPPEGKHWIWSQDRIDEAFQKGWFVFTHPDKPRLKRYLEDYSGRSAGSIWTDIFPVNAMAKERLGYNTQKPQALLERIIQASSEPGDVVLDPFCGCGTAVVAAQALNRRWIGIDVTHLAINLIEYRLRTAFPEAKYFIHGLPKDLEGASKLAAENPYEFQYWACSLVKAHPAGKVADKGVDGFIYFKPDGKTPEPALVSVKGGKNITESMIRDLLGAMELRKAKVGLFITLTPPTRNMESRALEAGYFQSIFGTHRRVQILTIQELLLEGRKPDIPYVDMSYTFKPSARIRIDRQNKLL